MHFSNSSDLTNSNYIHFIKQLDISLSDLCLTSISEIVDRLKTCCNIKEFLNKHNQECESDSLTLDTNNSINLTGSDMFLFFCNARIVELYLNLQYDSSIKGLKLCDLCNHSDDSKYFYVFKPESRSDKLEIKLLGIPESHLPIVYNIWKWVDENVSNKSFCYTGSNINWSNVGKMLQNSSSDSMINPTVINLFESVKKHAEMNASITQQVSNNSKIDISTRLDAMTDQLNRLELKIDAICNHLFKTND